MRNDIDVIICTYNNAELLDSTMSSLFNHKVTSNIRWSVTVVNNNCSDNTLSLLIDYQLRSPNFPLRIVNESRQGQLFARQRGVKETAAPFIVFVDDDCLLHDGFIDNIFNFFAAHPNAGAVGGKVTPIFQSTSTELVEKFKGYYASQNYGEVQTRVGITGFGYLVGAGLGLRRKALEESRTFERSKNFGRKGNILNSGDDTEIVLSIRNAGYELWYIPEIEITHIIPERRTSLEYLCRLAKGIGASEPSFIALSEQIEQTLYLRIKTVLRGCIYFLRVFSSYVFHFIVNRGKTEQIRKVWLRHAWGYLCGAWRMLLQA